ncbi:MAG: hypothetical protein JNN11_01130 [Candidatus Doudnabacteria bacterium]|nr:hypothetical protein [Candidatus Doudnabacteria bacterium]
MREINFERLPQEPSFSEMQQMVKNSKRIPDHLREDMLRFLEKDSKLKDGLKAIYKLGIQIGDTDPLETKKIQELHFEMEVKYEELVSDWKKRKSLQ